MVFFVHGSKLLPYKSRKWKWMHWFAKPLVESMIRTLARECEPILAHKMKTGWQNPEIKLLYDHLTEVIEKDNRTFLPTYDHVKDAGTGFRNVMCCILDEDSHFTLRWFYFLDILFRDKEKYNLEWHKNKAYWDWEKIREELMKGDPKWQEHLAKLNEQQSGSTPTAKQEEPGSAG